MKVGWVAVVFIIALIILAITFITPGYCTQPQEQQLVAGMPAIDTGIATVDLEQAVNKAVRIVMSIHSLAIDILPYSTLLTIIIGGILGIILKPVRVTILWAVFAMLLILWGPQLVGLVEYLKTI